MGHWNEWGAGLLTLSSYINTSMAATPLPKQKSCVCAYFNMSGLNGFGQNPVGLGPVRAWLLRPDYSSTLHAIVRFIWSIVCLMGSWLIVKCVQRVGYVSVKPNIRSKLNADYAKVNLLLGWGGTPTTMHGTPWAHKQCDNKQLSHYKKDQFYWEFIVVPPVHQIEWYQCLKMNDPLQ